MPETRIFLTTLPAGSSMDREEDQVDRKKNWLDTIKYDLQDVKLTQHSVEELAADKSK